MVFPALRTGMQAGMNALNTAAQGAQAQQNMPAMQATQTQLMQTANPGGNAANSFDPAQQLSQMTPQQQQAFLQASQAQQSGQQGAGLAAPPGGGAAQQWHQMTPQQQQAFQQAGGPMFSPYGNNGSAGGQALNPYGYGQAPNSSNRGYYEQQTPAGSFAAADQQRAGAYTANANMAVNPYIGMTSAGISGQPSVMSYAERSAANALRENPYLGMTTGTASAAQNSMAGLNNPYLTQAIDNASSDAARNYNMAIAPQRDRQMQQSGSFGNTGIQQMQLEDQRNFGQTLGNIANSARMADYNQQFGAAENLANRQTGVSQFNSGLNAGDIGRNLGGFFTGQGLGLQGTSQLLDAAKFDANMGNSVNQFNSTLGANDLTRNANLAQGMGQFNAGQGNSVNMFNAGALNTNSMFNAGQGNNMNLANAGAANNMLAQYRNLSEQGRQFDERFDYDIYRGNVADARGVNRDYIDMLNSLMGMNSGAYNMAGNAYQMPWQFLTGAGNLGATIGGMGGTTSQNMSGNPFMGAIGGYMIGNQIFNPNQRGGN